MMMMRVMTKMMTMLKRKEIMMMAACDSTGLPRRSVGVAED